MKNKKIARKKMLRRKEKKHRGFHGSGICLGRVVHNS